MLQEMGLTHKPWNKYESFLKFVLWLGPFDMDMPSSEILETEEQARALDLVPQLKEDQPEGHVHDVFIRHILGEMHILNVSHYSLWRTDDEDRIRQDPAAWSPHREAVREVAAKLARGMYHEALHPTGRYIREPKMQPNGCGPTA
jgi:hypothetical protein